MPLVYRFQGDARGAHFHPLIRGVLLAAADLLGLSLPRQNSPVASGATVAIGCTIGIGVGLRFLRQGRRSSSSTPFRSARAPFGRAYQPNDQLQPFHLAPRVLVVELRSSPVVLQAVVLVGVE